MDAFVNPETLEGNNQVGYTYLYSYCIDQTLKYLLQGRLTKCLKTLSLGRIYVQYDDVR